MVIDNLNIGDVPEFIYIANHETVSPYACIVIYLKTSYVTPSRIDVFRTTFRLPFSKNIILAEVLKEVVSNPTDYEIEVHSTSLDDENLFLKFTKKGENNEIK